MSKISNFKKQYFLSNLLKGLIWLLVIIGLFLIFKKYFGGAYTELMFAIDDKPVLVFFVFILSEVFFGIIPPELFMIWALNDNSQVDYFWLVLLLAMFSYLSGIIGYYFGLNFSKTDLFQNLRDKFASKFEKNVKKFGGFMIAVAALTPVPYSAICMMTGAARFNRNSFLLISSIRIIRFLIYGFVIWQVNQI